MKEKTKLTFSLLGMTLLILAMGMPSFAEAGRGHHRHNHHGHHYDGYGVIINQPPVYYSQAYYQPYALPIYGHNYYSAPAPITVPAYGYAPNIMLDIHTGNGRFMINY